MLYYQFEVVQGTCSKRVCVIASQRHASYWWSSFSSFFLSLFFFLCVFMCITHRLIGLLWPTRVSTKCVCVAIDCYAGTATPAVRVLVPQWQDDQLRHAGPPSGGSAHGKSAARHRRHRHQPLDHQGSVRPGLRQLHLRPVKLPVSVPTDLRVRRFGTLFFYKELQVISCLTKDDAIEK